MEAEIRLFAMFREYLPGGSTLFSFTMQFEGGKTAGMVIDELGLPPEVPKIIIVGTLQVTPDYEIRDGDVVSIFPPVGGG